MSDPRHTDPRPSEPPLQNTPHARGRIGELDKSNAMWGWIAGGIVLALLLVFVFGRSTSDTASTQMNAPPPGQSTLSPPTAPPTPPAAKNQSPSPTTGQGTSR